MPGYVNCVAKSASLKSGSCVVIFNATVTIVDSFILITDAN